VLTDSLADCLALHVLHDHKHTLILDQNVVDSGYVLVVQLGSALGLFKEPFAEDWVLAVLAPDHLNCYVALEQSVFSEKHFAHSASAKLCFDQKSIDTAAREIMDRDAWMCQAAPRNKEEKQC
jgi:hypothetical protein